MRLFGLLLDRAGSPQRPALSLVKAKHQPAPLSFDALRDKHPVAPDHGRRIATLRKFHRPNDVLGGAPLDGNAALISRAIIVWPAP